MDFVVLNSVGDRDLAQTEIANIPTADVLLDAVLISTLVGTHYLWLRAQSADNAIYRLEQGTTEHPWSFDGLGSTWGALAATVVMTLALEAADLLRFPPIYGVFDLPILFFETLPIAAFVWAFAVVLLSIDRLGSRALNLEPFPRDRTLGLKPIGSLVFLGFAVVSVAIVLALLAIGRYFGDFVIGIGIYLALVLVLVRSMWRLHRQMLQAKDGYVATARKLYVDAYAPVRNNPTLEVLEAQSRKLSAAESIEKRAESIHVWPIDDSTVARFAVITTGVFTGLLVRVILTAFGL